MTTAVPTPAVSQITTSQTVLPPAPMQVGAPTPPPASAPDIGALLVRITPLARYFFIALLFTPVTYRVFSALSDTVSQVFHEREHIVSGALNLSPVAYFTRLSEDNTTTRITIKEEDYVETIPDSLGAIAGLESLHIAYNPITKLPDSIGELSALQYLLVQNTKLRTLPPTIGANTALTDLSLQGNQIRTLPDAFGSLQNLEVLNLAHNELTELPPSVRNLTKTILLDLTGNKLRTVPRYLPPNLEVLFLGGNPIPLNELEQLQLRNALNDLIIYF
jgi:hypothetical protein